MKRMNAKGELVDLTAEEIAQREADEASADAKAAARAAVAYRHKRAEAYPPIGEQLDMLYHAMDTGALPKVTEFYDAIKAVKTAHPKPTE